MTRDDEQRLKVRANYLIMKYTWNYLKGESTLDRFFEWLGISDTYYSKILNNSNTNKASKEDLVGIKTLNNIPKIRYEKNVLRTPSAYGEFEKVLTHVKQ